MKESSFPVAVRACLQASSQRKESEQGDLEDLSFVWILGIKPKNYTGAGLHPGPDSTGEPLR